MATISEALEIAVQHHQAGQLQAAEQVYRQILAADPNQIDALHLLGVIASRLGRHEEAALYISRAIELRNLRRSAPFLVSPRNGQPDNGRSRGAGRGR